MPRSKAFIKVPMKVVQAGLSSTEIAVYVAVRSFANAKGADCWPTNEQIATRAGCSRAAAARAVKALSQKGLLVIIGARTKRRSFVVFG